MVGRLSADSGVRVHLKNGFRRAASPKHSAIADELRAAASFAPHDLWHTPTMAILDMPSASSAPTAATTWSIEIPLACLLGVLVAVSPVSTANRLLPSIGLGLTAAVALFFYRRSCLPRADARVRSLRTTSPVARWNVWLTASLLALILLPAARMLMPWYLESVWQNGHGLLLPLLILAVTTSILKRTPLDLTDGTLWGLLPMALGLGLIVLDLGMKTLHVSVVGGTLAAAGLVLVHFGWKAFLALSVPIAMLLAFLPLPTGLASELSMSTASASGAEWLLRAMGFAVTRSNSALFLPGINFTITTRCSGFGTLYAAITLAIAFGSVTGSWRRTAGLLVAAWPLAILANAIRLAVLMIFCTLRGVQPNQTPMHGFSGILAFMIVVAAIFLHAGRDARRRLLAP